MSMKLLVCCVVKHTFAIKRWFACSHCVIIKHTESQISMIVYNQGYVIVHETSPECSDKRGVQIFKAQIIEVELSC